MNCKLPSAAHEMVSAPLVNEPWDDDNTDDESPRGFYSSKRVPILEA